MADDADDKTEEATTKKLTEARNKGNVPQTMEARAFSGMVATLLILGLLSPLIIRGVGDVLQPIIERPHDFVITPTSMHAMLLEIGLDLMLVMAWPMFAVVVVTVGVSLYQTDGFMWVLSKIKPDLTKLSPLAGLKKMFGPEKLVELPKTLTKMGIIAVIIAFMVIPRFNEFLNLPQFTLPEILDYIHTRVIVIITVVLVIVLLMAIADFYYQKWRFMEKMKMTRQEVRDEHRQSEGDPKVKAKIASLRMARSRGRMMQSVPKADVIVTNPTHYAVALKYDMDTMSAPILVAKGMDHIAMKIRELADEHDIPIVENPPLARALYATVELDQEVPPDHYKAVAEIIGYVMRLKGKLAH